MKKTIVLKNTLFTALRSVVRHPLNKKQKIRALTRFVTWQIRQYIFPKPFIKKFTNNTYLVLGGKIKSGTANIYKGLEEFEEMSFLMHVLKRNDYFVDVGANIGTYTILASAAIGAFSTSIEPVESSFQRLMRNIKINNVTYNVEALNIGIASQRGSLQITTNLDSENYIATKSQENTKKIAVKTLDEVIGNRNPLLIKIDTEGYEGEILRGAKKTLLKDSLLAIIVELMEIHQNRYRDNANSIHKLLVNAGFMAYKYFPFERKLIKHDNIKEFSYMKNAIYIKDIEEVKKRIRLALKFTTNNRCNI